MPFSSAARDDIRPSEAAFPEAANPAATPAPRGVETLAYRRLKRRKGEAFARTLRDHHSGLLEIPDIEKIVRHAGDEAAPLIPYLMTLLPKDASKPQEIQAPQDPFVLLKQAGYDAFLADTEEKKNIISKLFARRELLCTFNDAARHEEYFIIHAVKEGAERLNREEFRGRENRQDAYGTSVISIQIAKEGGFIKITNRYNHGVSYSDNTFNSNPDNIIPGLSAALKNHFNVAFTANGKLPEGFRIVNDQIVQYHEETDNIFYGDQVYIKDGTLHAVDLGAGDALFEEFLFDNRSKTLRRIDPYGTDRFPGDFNRTYGGKTALRVDKDGNLWLKDVMLIGADKSRITRLNLPGLTALSENSLKKLPHLRYFRSEDLKEMGHNCLRAVPSLTFFSANSLERTGDRFLSFAHSLTSFSAPILKWVGTRCFYSVPALTCFWNHALKQIGEWCLHNIPALERFFAPKLEAVPEHLLHLIDRGGNPPPPAP